MSEFASRRMMMVDTQVRPSDVTKFPIIDAMLQVPREVYVPRDKQEAAYIGENVEIAPGRVVLEPRTLAKMLDALDIQPDEMVLDLGCGLGYSAAVIARQYEDEERYLESIKMLAERIAELVSHGQDHNAHFLCQYLIDYRRENGWEEWVEDAIETLSQWAATIQAGESVSVPSSVMGANAVD